MPQAQLRTQSIGMCTVCWMVGQPCPSSLPFWAIRDMGAKKLLTSAPLSSLGRGRTLRLFCCLALHCDTVLSSAAR